MSYEETYKNKYSYSNRMLVQLNKVQRSDSMQSIPCPETEFLIIEAPTRDPDQMAAS